MFHEVALLPCPAAFDLPERKRALGGIAGALVDGGEFDPTFRTGYVRNGKFVHFSGEAAVRAAEDDWCAERGKCAIKAGIRRSVEKKLQVFPISNNGKVAPGCGGDRGRCQAALGAELDHRNPLIQQKLKGVRSLATAGNDGVRLESTRLDPQGKSHGLASLPFQGCCVLNGDRCIYRQSHAAADDGALGSGGGCLRVVGIGGGIGRSGTAFEKVIDEGSAFIKSVRRFRSRRFGSRISEVNIEGRLGRWLDIGKSDPDVSLVEEAVVTFDLIGKRSFAIRRDEPQIAAVFASGSELEISIVKTDKHGGAAHRCGDSFGIEGDFLALRPGGIPPCVLGGQHAGQGKGDGQADKGNNRGCLLHGEIVRKGIFKSRPNRGR